MAGVAKGNQKAAAKKTRAAATKTKVEVKPSKAVNFGPERGDNSFPAGNKGRANTSSRGGGGAGGDGTSLKVAKKAKA